jgi:hypothetical protein
VNWIHLTQDGDDGNMIFEHSGSIKRGRVS